MGVARFFLLASVYFCFASSSDEGYSLTHLPDISSAVVQKETRELQMTVSIAKLDQTFEQLGSLSGIAYYSAVGYADSDLQHKIRSFYEDVKVLQERFTAAFRDFQSGSEEGVHKLATAFQVLSEGDKEKALPLLEVVQQKGQKLVQAADEVRGEAKYDEDKLSHLLETTRKAKAAYETKKENYERQRREAEAQRDRVQREQQNAAAAAQAAKREADAAHQEAEKEKKKRKDKTKGPFGIVHQVLDDVFNINLLKKHEKREKAARNEQRAHEENVKKHNRNFQEAERKLGEIYAQLDQLQSDVNLMNEAIASLHSAVGEFLLLSVSMQDMSTFWKGIENHCQDIVQSLKLAETAVSSESGETVKIWESPPFQVKAQQLYAKWLALNHESSRYVEGSVQMRARLAGLIPVKQPTIHEARKMVKQLKEGRKNIKDEL